MNRQHPNKSRSALGNWAAVLAVAVLAFAAEVDAAGAVAEPSREASLVAPLAR